MESGMALRSIKLLGVHPKHMGAGIAQSLIFPSFKKFKKKQCNAFLRKYTFFLTRDYNIATL